MIAAAMLYALAVSVPIALAVAGIAALLRRAGKPERWVWGAGIGATLALPLLLAYWRITSAAGAAGVVPAPPEGVFELPETVAVPTGGLLEELGVLLIAVWVMASAYAAIQTGRTLARLRRERRAWRPARLAGEDVLLTPDLGPAVYGVVTPEIVVPEGMRALPAQQLSLVVRHEREHIRARDPWLLAGGLLLRVLLPWHLGLAYLTRGLRQALEIDCDRRVTRAHGDVGGYGQTVLAVAALGPARARPLPAFTESTRFIRRRLIAMTRPTRTLGRLGLAAVAVFAVLAFAGACEMPLPLASDDRPEPEQAAVATESAEGAPTAEATTTETAESPEIDATEVPEPPVERSVGVEEGPTFTPFTTAPAILNRSELVQAMEENYPPLLKDAGIGGTIRIYMFVDESGQVRDTRIDESSGHPALDDAALRVAGTYRFSPALKDDAPVAVWIAMPVTFQVR